MNVMFQDSNPQAVVKEDVIVAGAKVGTVENTTAITDAVRCRYHAKIQLDGLALTSGLVQGFGPSKEEAVKNALDSSRKNAVALLEKLDAFELKLYAL